MKPILGFKGTEKFLEVRLCLASKNFSGFYQKQLSVDFVEIPVSATLPEAREQKYLRTLGSRFTALVKFADSMLPIFSTIALRKFALLRFVPANSIKTSFADVRSAKLKLALVRLVKCSSADRKFEEDKSASSRIASLRFAAARLLSLRFAFTRLALRRFVRLDLRPLDLRN
jgi:hypothetical protein